MNNSLLECIIMEADQLLDEKHFVLDLLDVDKFVKVNELQEITNSVYFSRDGIPSPDGLLSNEIFGISKEDRSNIFAYIDLGGWFLHPLIYKIWSRMDSNLTAIIHGTKSFRIDAAGQFVEDENGENGIEFIRKNIDKIRIRRTDSAKRNNNIEFLMKSKSLWFIRKMLVIPAYYRDVNTDGGYVGVGEINQLYSNLMMGVIAFKETADFGIWLSRSANCRVQETLLQIYDWFGAGTTINGKQTSVNLPKKTGIIKRGVIGKTTDYASRLVLSAPELKVEYVDDLDVDLEHTAVPLASLATNLFPYILFWVRRFFENEFAGSAQYEVMDKNGNIRIETVKDPQEQFSDEEIKHQIERFMKGFSNRFIPVQVKCESGKTVYMRFKGRSAGSLKEPKTNEEILASPLVKRRLTWCDLIYMAAVEMSKDKCILITRYPMDSYFNQFPSKIVVSSTKKTEPMFVNGELYPKYPSFTDEDIEQDTSNKFIDTMRMCNLHLGIIDGDYEPVTIVVF